MRRSEQRGFTLVELVAVIVLLGIIGTGTVSFISDSAEAYREVTRRDEVAQLGRFTVERISRELRSALPGSISINAAGSCIRFVPVLGVSIYTELPVTLAANTFSVVSAAPAGSSRVAVYSLAPANVYPEGSHILPFDISSAAVLANGATQYTFSSPPQNFSQAAPASSQRIYFVDLPVSFCVAASGDVFRYSNLNYAATDPTAATAQTNGDLLAQFVALTDGGSAVMPFQFDNAVLTRNGIIHLDLRFLARGTTDEWVRFSHDVVLRGSP